MQLYIVWPGDNYTFIWYIGIIILYDILLYIFFAVFLTGSDRIPILGMKSLKLTIQPTGGGDDFLPVAHTCFNLLDLPKYTRKSSLRDKLIQAIDHYEGFNLVWRTPIKAYSQLNICSLLIIEPAKIVFNFLCILFSKGCFCY